MVLNLSRMDFMHDVLSLLILLVGHCWDSVGISMAPGERYDHHLRLTCRMEPLYKSRRKVM